MNKNFFVFIGVVVLSAIVVLFGFSNSNSGGFATFSQRSLYTEVRRIKTPASYARKRGPNFKVDSKELKLHGLRRAGGDIVTHLEYSIGGLISGPLGMWRNGIFEISNAQAEPGADIYYELEKLGFLELELQMEAQTSITSEDTTFFDMLELPAHDIRSTIEFVQLYSYLYNNHTDTPIEDWANLHKCKFMDANTLSCQMTLGLYRSDCYACENSIAIAQCDMIQHVIYGTVRQTGKLDFKSCARTLKIIGTRVVIGNTQNLILQIILIALGTILIMMMGKSYLSPEKLPVNISGHGVYGLTPVHTRIREFILECFCMVLPWFIIGEGFGLFTPMGIHGLTLPEGSMNILRAVVMAIIGSLHIGIWSCVVARFAISYDRSMSLRAAYNADINIMCLIVCIIASAASTMFSIFVVNKSMSMNAGEEMLLALVLGVPVDIFLRVLLCKNDTFVEHPNSVIRIRNMYSGPCLVRAYIGPFFRARDRYTIIPGAGGRFCQMDWLQVAMHQYGNLFWFKTAIGMKQDLPLKIQRVKRGSNTIMVLNKCAMVDYKNSFWILMYQDSQDVGLPEEVNMYTA